MEKTPGENLSTINPTVDTKLGQTGLLINKILNPEIPKPKMEEFGHFYEDLKYDKERVKAIEDDLDNEAYRRANDHLNERGENNGNDRLDKVVDEMKAEEKQFSELLEETLARGIINDKWINYNGKNKESFKIHELATIEKADDYRNRIDAPFYFEFPANEDGETERIFVGFDATLSIDPDTLSDKLTRSTNVSRERKQPKNLPFGFSTLRYAYDPSNGERIVSDEVIRYTICSDRKLFKTMQKMNSSTKPLAEKMLLPEYQEVRFKILSEMYEQNKFFKAMNPDNDEATEKITKIDIHVWKGIQNTMDAILIGANESSPFFILTPISDEIKTLKHQYSNLPSGSPEKLRIQSEIKKNYSKLYTKIGKLYRSGDAGAKDNSYGKIFNLTHDFINAAKNTDLLDQYKSSQPRNIPFGPDGNALEMKEWYGKTTEDGKKHPKSN